MTTKFLTVTGRNIIVDIGTVLKPQVILNDLSVHIPQGCIYGLIGPSGSGKTSFQRTIIGVYKINSGSLSVFGQTPGAKGSCVPGPLIGYMPQEIALDDELTPKELLTFLGKCAGLKSDLIEKRIDEILSVMDIDCQDRRTSAFSVGQRRRLSLACTLIHSPKLLLLDEPTVGSDIVVVKKIWDYLRYLSDSQGTTIVISTHYLEEVTKADYFGFMSKGRMLIEGQPKPFIEFMGAITFEQAILKKFYELNFNQKPVSPNLLPLTVSHMVSAPSTSSKMKNLDFFSIITLLSLRYLLRWKISLSRPFICLVLCVIFNEFFMPSFYGEPMKGMSLAYLDLSNSSNYLHNITEILKNSNIKMIQVFNEEAGRSLVKNQRAEGYFILPNEFDTSLSSRVLTPNNQITGADQSAGRIILYQDTAFPIKPDIILLRLSEALLKIMDTIASEANKRNNLEYIKIEGLIERLDEPERLASKHIFSIHILVFCIEISTMILLTFLATNEMREPMTERLISLGFKRYHLVTAFIILATLFLTPTFFITIKINIFLLGTPMFGNWIPIIVILVCVVICGIGKAILLGSANISNVDCLLLNIMYSATVFHLGCFIFPYDALSYFVQPLTYLFPQNIPSEALVRIMVYGNGLENPKVLLGLIYTPFMAAVHLAAVFYVTRKWHSRSKLDLQ